MPRSLVQAVDLLLREWAVDVANPPSGLPTQAAFMLGMSSRSGFTQFIDARMMTSIAVKSTHAAVRRLELEMPLHHAVIHGRYIFGLGERAMVRSLGLPSGRAVACELQFALGYLARDLRHLISAPRGA